MPWANDPGERELAQQYDVSRTTIVKPHGLTSGLVDVRVGSGSMSPQTGRSGRRQRLDIGAFELTRRASYRRRVAAQAALHARMRISRRSSAAREMEKANRSGAGAGELIDRQFTTKTIARMSSNGAWSGSAASLDDPQTAPRICVRMLKKSRDKGKSRCSTKHAAIAPRSKQRILRRAGAMPHHWGECFN